MTQSLIRTSKGPPGVSFFLMDYIEGALGVAITLAGTSSISYTAYKRGTSTVINSGTIDKAVTVFDTPVTTAVDPRWKAKDPNYPAYNFGWQVPVAAVPSGFDAVRLVIIGVHPGADALTWMVVHDREAENIGLVSTTPNLIVARRGDRLSVALPLLGNISARSKLWWTLKKSTTDPDDEAVVALTELGGLITVNGAPASSSSLGSLTVTNATTGATTLVIDETIMAQLEPAHALFWDCQFKASGVLSTPRRGQFRIPSDVTIATS